ncbi:MAG TPA: RNA methyltransferase [Flavobacteriales bacterium]|nr:RNA methyltransferase [Flavobacteriales bacterium]
MYNPDLQEYLERFISIERINRIKRVLDERTRYVTVVLEDVWQAQNASAAIRTSECMGLQEVHIIKNGDRYKINKQVVRGASKWMQIHKYTKHANNTRVCLEQLKQRGYRIAATVPHENARQLTNLDVFQKTAFVFGTEKTGVSADVLDMCDERIFIPMYGFTESFNISVSVAMCLFYFINETKKQNIRWNLEIEEQNELLMKWTRQSIKRSDLIVSEFYTALGGKNKPGY